jgi:N-methylhydantoinase B
MTVADQHHSDSRRRDGIDAVTVEVIGHYLAAVAEEMAAIIWRTGRSPMLKTGDFVTVIANERGEITGPGFGASFQFALIQDVLRNVLREHGSGLVAGDVLITNDPYAGMAHMPDVAVLAPAFVDDVVVGFCACYSHHADIGGRFAGGISSQPRTTYEEGLRIPILKLHSAGRPNEAVLRLIAANTRVPEEWLSDLQAKVSACHRGSSELQRLIEGYGREVFAAACDELIDDGQRRAHSAIDALPAGIYDYEDSLEDDGFSDLGRITLRLELTIEQGAISVDFGGSDPEVPSALNMPWSMTRAATIGTIQAVLGPDVPVNAGVYRQLRVAAPSGSVVSPTHPAAVGGYTPLFFRVCDMVMRSLGKAAPSMTPVPPEGGDVMHFSGRHPDGTTFNVMDLFYGGWGGRPGKDGIDGVAPVYMGSHGSIGVELIERDYPLVIEGFGYVPDSGGSGQYRGSVGIFRGWRYLAAGDVTIRTLRLVPSAGIAGGGPGGPSITVLESGEQKRALERRSHVHLAVVPGDRLYHETAGAGGYGDVRLRSEAGLRDDVMLGKVSPAGARSDYGRDLPDAAVCRRGIDDEATDAESEATHGIRR